MAPVLQQKQECFLRPIFYFFSRTNAGTKLGRFIYPFAPFCISFPFCLAIVCFMTFIICCLFCVMTATIKKYWFILSVYNQYKCDFNFLHRAVFTEKASADICLLTCSCCYEFSSGQSCRQKVAPFEYCESGKPNST